MVTELRATESFSSLDATKAKYSNSRLYVGEKRSAKSRINSSNFFACEENKSIG
jgi:hypothetical protein